MISRQMPQGKKPFMAAENAQKARRPSSAKKSRPFGSGVRAPDARSLPERHTFSQNFSTGPANLCP
jgi:hypothetical protein